MKRRNVDSSKTRRPVKKIPKLYDGFYTSLVVYVKLLLMWICVMGGDFILEFRLEYLYPMYLLLHNSYEAYKFQGIAFAILLVCIVVSVDVICLGVIPAPWLYLLGSLAVWGQVSWSLTPLGPLLLLPTLIYIDGKSIRPLPSQPLSPLAAHCVGFPMVSLAFGLKCFIGARLKQRTKNEVARQNEVLYSVLWEALPFISPPVNNNEVITNGTAVLMKKQQLQSPLTPAAVPRRKSIEVGDSHLGSGDPVAPALPSKPPSSVNHNQNHNPNNVTHQNCNNNNTSNANNNNSSSLLSSNSSSSSTNSSSMSGSSAAASAPAVVNSIATSVASTNGPTPVCNCFMVAKKKKDDCCFKLESEVRKLRSELHVMRTLETELRSQITSYLSSERNLRGDLAALQGEHESLQLKYSALLSKGQEERQSYEKKLFEERRQKENAISKQKKASQECSGDCRRKLREADREKESLRRDIKLFEEKNLRTERELQNVKSTLLHEQKNKESSAETARLLSLLSALQDQNAHLESSLSAETRLKLDLFSALGEARRQLQIRDSFLKSKEEELDEVRGQLVELLAVTDFSNQQHPHDLQQVQLRCVKNSVGMTECHPSSSSPQQRNDALSFSPLIES
ncbi:unnamed protein product [Allacma fusca]|uniref:Macoilin n=1 Tax=Allacma fusca TaxID=39272 RepID=A0A8J2PE93_9HEXA|nr:unnamed protein product [Allacma fusca]